MKKGKPPIAPPAPPPCGVCGKPADVERHGDILRRCLACVRRAVESTPDLKPCICCGVDLDEHNANLAIDGDKTGLWEYCADCFEDFDHRIGEDEGGAVAYLKMRGYYRLSRPRRGGRCSVLDPRPLIPEIEPVVRAELDVEITKLAVAVKDPKTERDDRKKMAARLARLEAIAKSPREVRRIALSRAKGQKLDEAIKACRSKLVLVVRSLSARPDFDLTAALREGRMVLSAETNSRTGYVGFELEGRVG